MFKSLIPNHTSKKIHTLFNVQTRSEAYHIISETPLWLSLMLKDASDLLECFLLTLSYANSVRCTFVVETRSTNDSHITVYFGSRD